jgi:hypothetical protein
MSTRSQVGIIRKDGSIVSVYVHSDGYPSGVGADLLAHYTDPAKIEALIALGDISYIGDEIGEKHSFEVYDAKQCRAYHRDRGEEFNQSSFPSIAELEVFLEASDREWCYLWDEVSGVWSFSATPDEYSGRPHCAWAKLTPEAVA